MDLKHPSPIKSDLIPSPATTKSYEDKLKLLPKPSNTKYPDKNVHASKHTRPIENSHYPSFSANNHSYNDILNQTEKSNYQSFGHEKVECPRSFDSNLPPKRKSSIDMEASRYTTFSSDKDGDCSKINQGVHMNAISNNYLSSHIRSLQRYDTHLSLREAKSYFNSLLSHYAQSMKHLSLHRSGSEY